jgi:UDP-N-acetylglucosamine:LPS N-acetylglucosamine transferase
MKSIPKDRSRPPEMRYRLLILSAGMGAGHDAVAVELGARLAAAGHEADVVDVLELLPLGLGRALRRWYGWMMRRVPWSYALIYRVFFAPGRARAAAPGGRRPASLASPLTVLAAARLDRLVRRGSPDLVVSTFHLAAQAAGHLRRTGRLRVPSAVLLTDFAAHRLWLHPSTDHYLCPCPETARDVTAATGRAAASHAPLTRPVFGCPPAETAIHALLGVRPEDRLILVTAGSWGVGEVEDAARVLAGTGRYVPVVLCGRNDALRVRLREVPGTVALGWRDDVPELMAVAYALVDNAAGLTCREAFAAGLPVVSYRPIPGHGHAGVLAMARAGLSVHADDAARLVAELDRLGDPVIRSRLVTRAAALFDAPSAEDLLFRPYAAPVRGPDGSRSPGRTG